MPSRCCTGWQGAATQARDHPSKRREQVAPALIPAQIAGPAPRARGAVRRLQDRILHGGAIPAGAGSRLPDLWLYRSTDTFSWTFTDSDKSAILAPLP
ncbi:hypothetical protein SGPA1_22095 [Streptomyces misionensis JCM 4497]